MAENKEIKGSIRGTWKTSKESIAVNLPLILFEDGGCNVVYCPAVDVYGYGKTESEALESFTTCLGEFFLYTTHKKTLASELKKLGWNIITRKKFTPPSMEKLLSANRTFSDIFNTRSFRKIDQEVSIPAYC